MSSRLPWAIRSLRTIESTLETAQTMNCIDLRVLGMYQRILHRKRARVASLMLRAAGI